jgi:hypothetical protein
MKNMLYAERIKQFEAELIPVGIMGDDGMGELHPLGDGWKVWKGQ